jgi:hypothetical protein
MSFGFSEAMITTLNTQPHLTMHLFWRDAGNNKYQLGDDAYRTLIMCKAFTNISIATIPDINKFLKIMFYKRGRAYCINYRDMTMGITFEFELAPYEESI